MAKAKRKKVDGGMSEKDEVMNGEGYTAEINPLTGNLLFTIGIDRKGRPSKFGKMMLLATSGGWKKIGDVSFSFNVGRKV